MVDEAPMAVDHCEARPDSSDDHPLLPLVARGLQFGINGRKIIKDVSFWIGSSGRTVILGPNGAGKSVMLRLCHGLLKPGAGEIRWGDLPVAQAREQQAMAAQHPVLLRRTVTGNLLHVLRVKGVPRNAVPGARGCRVTTGRARGSRWARSAHPVGRPAAATGHSPGLRTEAGRAAAGRAHANLDPAAVRGVEELIGAIGAAGTKN